MIPEKLWTHLVKGGTARVCLRGDVEGLLTLNCGRLCFVAANGLAWFVEYSDVEWFEYV